MCGGFIILAAMIFLLFFMREVAKYEDEFYDEY